MSDESESVPFVFGFTAEENATRARIDAGAAEFERRYAEQVAKLTPSDAAKALAFVRDHLPLVGPALGLLGVGGPDERSKAAEAARLLGEVLALLGV